MVSRGGRARVKTVVSRASGGRAESRAEGRGIGTAPGTITEGEPGDAVPGGGEPGGGEPGGAMRPVSGGSGAKRLVSGSSETVHTCVGSVPGTKNSTPSTPAQPCVHNVLVVRSTVCV